MDLICAGDDTKVPHVLHQDVLRQLFASITPIRTRLMCETLYVTGMRLREMLALEVADIDSARMMVHVRQGKGQYDRIVPLPHGLLLRLRDHARRFKPKTILFFGKSHDKSLGPTAVQRTLRKACATLGIEATPHTLRHCYATHLLETGTDLSTVMVYLGHRTIRTTAIYNHVRRREVTATVSPLEFLNG